MPHYMTTGRYTAEAVNAMLSSPEDRTDHLGGLVRRFGGNLIEYYLVLGDSDFVLITEFPDNGSALSWAALLAGDGQFEGITTKPLIRASDSVALMVKASALSAKLAAACPCP
ncbi:MAG: GYD domain-containing protein [Geminicoccaceae bacterium]